MNVIIAAVSAPTHMNGVSRHAANLARALLSTNAISEIHFLAGAWQKDMFRNALGACDSRLHSHWITLRDANLSRLFWYYRELPCIAAQLEADTVHLTFPAPVPPAAYPCSAVLTLHDLYPFEIPRNFGRLKSAVARHTVTQCIRRVDAVACVSSVTRNNFIRLFPAQAHKARVIHNFAEFKGSPVMTRNLEPLKDRQFILCVAQHRSNKNIPLAIRVFEGLLAEKILPAEARMVVVGNPGPETRKIEEEMRNARLSHKVLLFSGLSEAELRWCYQGCELLLAPSSTEGFGAPVAEALLAGARVVCSDIPAFREVGGEVCHYVSWTDDPVGEYVRAIRDAIAAPPPRAPSPVRFSAAATGEQFAHLYGELACSPLTRVDRTGQALQTAQRATGSRWK